MNWILAFLAAFMRTSGVFLIGAYLGTFPALYMALKNINPVAVFFATLFTFITVTIAFATEPTVTLLVQPQKGLKSGK